MTITTILEEKIQEIGKEIFRRAKSSRSSVFDRSFWSSKLIDLAIRNESLKINLFRFVDVLPTLKDDDELVKHIQEYFKDFQGEYSELLGFATKISQAGILGKIATGIAVRTAITQMARTFIAGENISEVTKKVKDLRNEKMAFTVDILGEIVLSEKEASHYQNLYIELISGLSKSQEAFHKIPLLDDSPYGPLPKVNVSVKLSSLYSQTDPMDFTNTVSVIKNKLRPILQVAKKENAFIYVDMESCFYKDITIAVFKEILEEEEFKNYSNAGIVIQAYLKESEKDLTDLINWTKKRACPITVRLVKGAYWDYETIISKQKKWNCPVFENKFETDENFEKLSKLLIKNYPYVYTAIASHNVRSIAFVKSYAEDLNLPKGAIEYQFLFGMAGAIKDALVDMGERVRIYMPYGELLPGMAYLVRRLLENTSNESFLRQGFAEGISEDKLLSPPSSQSPSPIPPFSLSLPPLFSNIPDTDFIILKNRELMKETINDFKNHFDKSYPLVINGERVSTSSFVSLVNPSNTNEIIGKVAQASVAHADNAIEKAKEAFQFWQNTPTSERAKILQKAADIMKEKRFELAAIMIVEEGKPWREADGDVSEAIDFLNYYSIEAKKLFTEEKLLSPQGEENYSIYKPRGVAVIISPWNFPLAILTGLSSAALICGNTVILKPAKQASIIAYKYLEILEEASLPKGVCNYLPGEGKVIGNYLVQHKNINLIAFTGSMEVGLSINNLAAEQKEGQDFVKKVICEMGGKNAIVIDNDADLDEAVKGVIYSAFGYAGQKCSACSRVIVVKEIYEKFLERLVYAAKSIKVGPACEPASYYGPLIDKSAFENTLKYIEIGKKEGKLLAGGELISKDGYFISPTIFSDVHPNSTIAQEEIFGPVLSLIKAENFKEAISIANNVKYALTGGVFSRSPENIKLAKGKFNVGNLYINRACTGAKVGRQPFGGFKMSGIGAKAGGKDYLLQFVEPRIITENTMRRGFAPD